MHQLNKLRDRIIRRVNINLRRFDFDAADYLRSYIPLSQLTKFYAFYGITDHHPLYFHFSHSNLAGSYFLGKCKVDNAILYKSDIRGDELKSKGDTFQYRGTAIPLDHDEVIWIKDSFLVKTLVHNCSHDPENPEIFWIQNTASSPYANIHGSVMEGCFLGPFASVDLTSLHGCQVGTFSYLQVGELWHRQIEPGQIWIKNEDLFDFSYRFAPSVLKRYINFEPGQRPRGIFIDFVESRKDDFHRVFDVVHLATPRSVPKNASLSRYAVLKPKTRIGENVLVAQRAYLENSFLGKGANAQENCFLVNSHLQGDNVTAHGAKLIHTRLEEKVFVGFNSFLRGTPDSPLIVGPGSIIMPHAIIDLSEALTIPPGHLVWGFIQNARDLETHSIALKSLTEVQGELNLGAMRFQGQGARFVEAFQQRIEHILEANGAYYDGNKNKGHAQKGQNIAYNIIQPYSMGTLKGVYPTIDICP
ncbi:MAG: transferase [Desulfobacterales bacterium]|nr:MAG: transferase [Desulfobacterales bacterium]